MKERCAECAIIERRARANQSINYGSCSECAILARYKRGDFSGAFREEGDITVSKLYSLPSDDFKQDFRLRFNRKSGEYSRSLAEPSEQEIQSKLKAGW